MSCGKVCEKLWNNYLNKYGDFRERSRTIRNDQQCLLQLSHIKQQLSNSAKKSELIGRNRKLSKKCDPLLPAECCRLSPTTNHLSLVLNKSDREKLEKLIEAENFPDNIFPANIESRLSIDNETELSATAKLHRLTSPMNSMFSKNSVNYPVTKNDERSSMSAIMNRSITKIEKILFFRPKSMQKSELGTSSHNPAPGRIRNPYSQLIERLRKAEKSKHENLDLYAVHPSFDSPIDSNTHNRIEQFLSFLYSLDDTTDHAFDESTLISLFSIDNCLTSSMYVPVNIQQIEIVPKTILHSLKTTPVNEDILNEKIQSEITKKNSQFLNIKAKQSYLNDSWQTSHFVDQDNELHSRLSNTYTVQAFKNFLIEHNKSTRLPKLFDDLEQRSRN